MRITISAPHHPDFIIDVAESEFTSPHEAGIAITATLERKDFLECEDCGVWTKDYVEVEEPRLQYFCHSCAITKVQNRKHNDARLGGERRYEG